jgi:RNA polymerase sigma-B factor
MQVIERDAPPGGRSPLWADWDQVQRKLVPCLQEIADSRGGGRVWCTDSVADAVALTAAYWQATGGRMGRLRVFAPPVSERVEFLSFRLSDIRPMPSSARHATLRRDHGSWRPRVEIASSVALGAPNGPVDVIVTGPGSEVDPGALIRTHLRPGGVLAVPAVGSEQSALRLIDSIGGVLCLYRYLPGPGQVPVKDAAGEDDESLAQHLRRADLVDSHIQLARSLARRFANRGEAIDDLEQVALLALIKAAKRFDETRYDAFAPYATACVVGEIKKHFRDKAWALRVPRSLQETFLAVKRAGDDLVHEVSRSPTIAEIAARVGTTKEAVLEAMEASTAYSVRSFDYASEDGSATDVAYEEEGYGRALERLQVRMLAPRLSDLERVIIQRIYFEGLSQRQVAEDLGWSQMYVSRAVRSALEKLRE